MKGSEFRFNGIRVVRYPSMRAVLARFLGGKPEEFEIGGTPTTGGRLSMYQADDLIAGTSQLGMWGFTDVPRKTIHLWLKRGANDGILMNFLSHELAHVRKFDGPSRKRGIINDEKRANRFGKIGQEAIGLAVKLKRRA